MPGPFNFFKAGLPYVAKAALELTIALLSFPSISLRVQCIAQTAQNRYPQISLPSDCDKDIKIQLWGSFHIRLNT